MLPWLSRGAPSCCPPVRAVRLSQVLTNDTPGLLAVSDDVDACVLQAHWPPHAPHPTVKHVATIPALAYIVAGKTQRKHLLVGELGGGGTCVPLPTAAGI